MSPTCRHVPILWRRPHAAVLMDITTRRLRPNVYRSIACRPALVIANRARNGIERRIAICWPLHRSRQRHDRVASDKRHEFFRPPTAACRLGRHEGGSGRAFVVAFGEGAFKRMLAS